VPLLPRLVAVSFFLFPLFASAASPAITLPDGCGDDGAQYKVKTEKSASLSAAGAGLAQLVVIHSLVGEWGSGPIARVAVDGKWVGAVKGRSYFAIGIPPGTHKVCVSRQSGARLEKENVEVAIVEAKANESTFLNFTINRRQIDALSGHPTSQMINSATPDMTAKEHETLDEATLRVIDADDALVRIKKLPQSVPEQK
jgi:hypothetical protein